MEPNKYSQAINQSSLGWNNDLNNSLTIINQLNSPASYENISGAASSSYLSVNSTQTQGQNLYSLNGPIVRKLSNLTPPPNFLFENNEQTNQPFLQQQCYFQAQNAGLSRPMISVSYPVRNIVGASGIVRAPVVLSQLPQHLSHGNITIPASQNIVQNFQGNEFTNIPTVVNKTNGPSNCTASTLFYSSSEQIGKSQAVLGSESLSETHHPTKVTQKGNINSTHKVTVDLNNLKSPQSSNPWNIIINSDNKSTNSLYTSCHLCNLRVDRSEMKIHLLKCIEEKTHYINSVKDQRQNKQDVNNLFPTNVEAGNTLNMLNKNKRKVCADAESEMNTSFHSNIQNSKVDNVQSVSVNMNNCPVKINSYAKKDAPANVYEHDKDLSRNKSVQYNTKESAGNESEIKPIVASVYSGSHFKVNLPEKKSSATHNLFQITDNKYPNSREHDLIRPASFIYNTNVFKDFSKNEEESCAARSKIRIKDDVSTQSKNVYQQVHTSKSLANLSNAIVDDIQQPKLILPQDCRKTITPSIFYKNMHSFENDPNCRAKSLINKDSDLYDYSMDKEKSNLERMSITLTNDGSTNSTKGYELVKTSRNPANLCEPKTSMNGFQSPKTIPPKNFKKALNTKGLLELMETKHDEAIILSSLTENKNTQGKNLNCPPDISNDETYVPKDDFRDKKELTTARMSIELMSADSKNSRKGHELFETSKKPANLCDSKPIVNECQNLIILPHNGHEKAPPSTHSCELIEAKCFKNQNQKIETKICKINDVVFDKLNVLNDKVFDCSICNATFNSEKMLFYHQKLVTKCSRNGLHNKETFRSSIKTVSVSLRRTSTMCRVCFDGFENEIELENHLIASTTCSLSYPASYGVDDKKKAKLNHSVENQNFFKDCHDTGNFSLQATGQSHNALSNISDLFSNNNSCSSSMEVDIVDQCRINNTSCENKYSLDKHLKEKRAFCGAKDIKCKVCTKKFRDNTGLTAHLLDNKFCYIALLRKLLSKGISKLKCAFCQKEETSEKLFRKHYLKSTTCRLKYIQLLLENKRKSPSKTGSFASKHTSNLEHVETSKTSFSPSSPKFGTAINIVKSKVSAPKNEQTPSLTCNGCSKIFTGYCDLAKHLRKEVSCLDYFFIHDANASVIKSCKNCRKLFLCKTDVFSHKCPPIDKCFICKDCGCKFAREKHCQTHKLNNNHFLNSERVKQSSPHINKETVYDSFTGNTLSQSITLRRSFCKRNLVLNKCILCDDSFENFQELMKHSYKHKDTYELSCLYCQMKFSHFNTYVSHIGYHLKTDKHTREPEKKRSSPSLLVNEKSHVCPICQIGFNRYEKMKVHIQSDHIIEDPEPTIRNAFDHASKIKDKSLRLIVKKQGSEKNNCLLCSKLFKNELDKSKHLSVSKKCKVHYQEFKFLQKKEMCSDKSQTKKETFTKHELVKSSCNSKNQKFNESNAKSKTVGKRSMKSKDDFLHCYSCKQILKDIESVKKHPCFSNFPRGRFVTLGTLQHAQFENNEPVCLECDLTLSSASNLRTHLYRIHDLKMLDKNILFKAAVETRGEFHRTPSTGSKESIVTTCSETVNNSNKEDENCLFKCSICYKVLPSDKIKTHFLQSHPLRKKEYQNYFIKLASTEEWGKAHISKLSKPFNKVVIKNLDSESIFPTYSLALPVQKQPCFICGKDVSVEEYCNHIRTEHHIKFQLHTCNFCFSKFINEDVYLDHKKTCIQAKKCKHCKIVFATRSNLLSHNCTQEYDDKNQKPSCVDYISEDNVVNNSNQ